MELIADELHFARTSTEDVIETTLPMSVQRDGVTSFRRIELIEDLTSEEKQLRYMLKLHFVDEELHETHRTSSLHLECVALHGYRTYLWTKDAKVSLEREHNRLVARLVATDITRDILDWMLEGWHFGERQSRHKVVGYVPSIQKTGLVKAGTNVQVNLLATAMSQTQAPLSAVAKRTTNIVYSFQFLSRYCCRKVTPVHVSTRRRYLRRAIGTT